MSTLTTYMSLTAWTDTSDPYSHTQLANNFNAIDGHDHSSGKGKQVPTGGLADHSVTQIKLAEPSVGTDQLIDESVTVDKLDGSILAAFVPMGIIFPFWRPAATSTVVWGDRASGHLFEICDGRTIAESEHDLGIAGSIVLPNLIDRFALFGPEANIGVTGGSNTVSLAHSHLVNAHSHTVNGHTHTVSAHAHTIGDHRHGIDADGSHAHSIAAAGSHSHDFAGGSLLHSRPNAFITGIQVIDVNTFTRSNTLQSLYAAGYNGNGDPDVAVPMDANGQHDHGGTGAGGSHSHGGQTGLVNTGNLGTSSASPGTSSASPGTDAQSPGTNSALGAVENRPAFMTLVPLVRVRNP